jgi:hypothetical protein
MPTSYLDSICKVIENRMEYTTDELLVRMVRIQQLAQSISLTLTSDNANLQNMQLPLMMVVQSFQQQLDAYKASLPANLQGNGKHLLIPHFSLVRREVLIPAP